MLEELSPFFILLLLRLGIARELIPRLALIVRLGLWGALAFTIADIGVRALQIADCPSAVVPLVYFLSNGILLWRVVTYSGERKPAAGLLDKLAAFLVLLTGVLHFAMLMFFVLLMFV